MFTFIDLFAGIGGFRIACEQENGKCVFSSEINKYSCETYLENFKENSFCDITKISSKKIPKFDLLCAGFPCQPFSLIGKRLGFNDIRGTLIYEIIRIVRDKQPKVFLLENVSGLLSHDNGRTFRVIRKLLGKTFNTRREFFLEKENLQYNIFYKVLNSANFGLAQNRKRIFLVGFRKDIKGGSKFKFPKSTDKKKVIKDILENKVNKKYFVSEGRQNIMRGWKHRGNLNERILDISKKGPTLITTNTGYGANYIKIKNKIRFLTPREYARLQGFPENFVLHKNDNHAYFQFGNAISPPVIREIIKEINKII